jgi:ribosomal protein S18 acetylase RimI-like enzyme
MAVEQERRGQGVGRTLLRTAIAFVSGQGADYLNLWVDPHNEGAIALYRREGFRDVGEVEHLIEMRIAFRPTDTYDH